MVNLCSPGTSITPGCMMQMSECPQPGTDLLLYLSTLKLKFTATSVIKSVFRLIQTKHDCHLRYLPSTYVHMSTKLAWAELNAESEKNVDSLKCISHRHLFTSP